MPTPKQDVTQDFPSPMPKVVAMIPARGGSVSIPKKNIKPLLGRPLIDWSIKAAQDSNVFHSIWVSTDDDEIAATAIACGALVHRRAPETATSAASTESAIKDFVDSHPDFDYVCLIQATSPLLVPKDFVEGFRMMLQEKADSLVTAVRAHRFIWSVDPATKVAKAKNYEPLKRPRRQDWNGELVENGAFYMFSKGNWTKHACRLGGKMVLYEMEEHTFTELDSLVDWQVVSHMAADYGYFPKGTPRQDPSSQQQQSSKPFYLGVVAGVVLSVAGGALLATRRK